MPPELLKGAQVLPGWNPGLVVAGDAIAEPLRVVRRELILITFGVIAGLIALFVLLSRHLTARVRALLDGSRAIAAGTLSWRIAVDGKDEIAAVALAFNRMAEKLEDMVRSAVESEKMVALGRFATSLAHEIRNPLSTVKTTVQALLATETQQDRREILTGVDDEIDRLDDALNDLLAYARPRPPQVARLMIWGMLDRLGAMANTLLHENKISLVKLGEPDLAVRADSGHVKQIMMNLMLNSIQAMPGGGVLTVRATRDGAMGMLEISDTGTGMSAEVLSRVTEPFFTTRADGTGLGLSISRQLTELNGGSLEIFSAVGHGTTVAVRLPLAEGER
jgi:two-component system sensor histidine kinase AtoS